MGDTEEAREALEAAALALEAAQSSNALHHAIFQENNGAVLVVERLRPGTHLDAVVQHLWMPGAPDDYNPSFTPDAAQLTVTYLAGRWFVVYIDLEEPTDAPPDRRVVMSRVLADPDRPFGITLSEV